MNEHDGIYWEPAYKIGERQTRQMAREFRTSRPRPRNRVMGFKGEDESMAKKRLREIRRGTPPPASRP